MPVKHLRVATNRLSLHAAVDGSGPPVILLHGFPEHWWSWRRQMSALTAAGFSAWALDLRGYNESDRPRGRAAYRLGELVEDIAGAIHATGETCCDVVGHDWGGIIAWVFAQRHPDQLRRLVVMNAPHPALFARELRRPRQLLASAYVPFFAMPWLSEIVLAAHDFAAIRSMFTRLATRPEAYSESDIEAFIAPLRMHGALTAALNYYRANLFSVVREGSRAKPIAAETLVLWGERDPALNIHLLDGLDRLVPRVRVRRFPGAGHWVHADEHERVNDALIGFLREASTPLNSAAWRRPRT